MSDYVSVGDVEVLAVGDSALLVEVEGSEVWVPFSQIDAISIIDDTAERGDFGELVVSGWLAKKEGWD